MTERRSLNAGPCEVEAAEEEAVMVPRGGVFSLVSYLTWVLVEVAGGCDRTVVGNVVDTCQH